MQHCMVREVSMMMLFYVTGCNLGEFCYLKQVNEALKCLLQVNTLLNLHYMAGTWR